MNAPLRIAAAVDEATFARVETAASHLGISMEQFAGDALRRAADEAIELAERLERGRAQVRGGDVKDHDAFMADLLRWRDDRVRPS